MWSPWWNVSTDADYFAYQLKYDSVHGQSKHIITTGYATEPKVDKPVKDLLIVCSAGQQPWNHYPDTEIKCIAAAKDPSLLPWKELGVEYVLECSGTFNKEEQLRGHLQAGAQKVILGAPGKGNIKTIVMGVNEGEYDRS
jgi:glyceraldehyde 3-phosphate dehydrogenase